MTSYRTVAPVATIGSRWIETVAAGRRPMALVDRGRRYVAASPSWRRWVGEQTGDITGRPADGGPGPATAAVERLRRLLDTLDVTDRRGLDPGFDVSRWTDGGGRLRGWLIVARFDVTIGPPPDRASWVRAVAEFAHDLRSPLTVIAGNADLLRQTLGHDSAAAGGDLVSAIQDGVARAVDLARDMLLAATEGPIAGPPRDECCDVLGLVREVAGRFRAPARARRLRLTCDAGDAVAPALHRTDAGRVRRVLENVIGNAVRFTDEGGVAVVARVDGRRLWITVSDTGVGIAPDQREALFDPFVRGADSDGHGLGLSIARRLVESLDGRIGVDSEPGVGSTFHIEIPLRPA